MAEPPAAAGGSSQELAIRTTRPSAIPSPAELAHLTNLANSLGQSGYWSDARNGFQALAKILIGRDLGLSPTAAIMGVDIIEGRPEFAANLQATMVRRWRGENGERYTYRVLEHTADKCLIEFRYKDAPDAGWEVVGESAFTIEDATAAELHRRGTKNGTKNNYQKYPRNMLFARAMTNGVAWYCPEVTSGTRIYAEGEIGERYDETGQPLPVDGSNSNPNAPKPGDFDAAAARLEAQDQPAAGTAEEIPDAEVVDPAPAPASPQPEASGGEEPEPTLAQLQADAQALLEELGESPEMIGARLRGANTVRALRALIAFAEARRSQGSR